VSTLDRPRARDRPRKRRSLVRPVLLVVAFVLVFLVGIAFGQALDDSPEPNGVTTSVRTLTALPQAPPARTVTVTVTQP
jgi:hypothetical protein